MSFKVFAGDVAKNYPIIKNENALVGLFQGMFQGNILTFNPDWKKNASKLKYFDDVPIIQQQLKNKYIQLISEQM